MNAFGRVCSMSVLSSGLDNCSETGIAMASIAASAKNAIGNSMVFPSLNMTRSPALMPA